MIEAVGILLELGIHLHHHVVLVDALIHGGDLALAKGVVEDAIDGLGGDPQAAGGIAVDDQTGLQPAILQVAIHIAQLRKGAQLLQNDGRPGVEVLEVVSLQRILELRVAGAAADLQILNRLQITGSAGHGRQLGPQPVDHGKDVRAAFR